MVSVFGLAGVVVWVEGACLWVGRGGGVCRGGVSFDRQGGWAGWQASPMTSSFASTLLGVEAEIETQSEASHAACDFRKLLCIESYSVTDNVSELTARINDESWESSYVEWMKVSNLNEKDGVFIFSVGGGDKEVKISMQLVSAMDYAKSVGASVMGVAGRSGWHLSKTTDNCVIIPELRSSSVTAQTEGFQALIWHMLLGHPELGGATPKWESVVKY